MICFSKRIELPIYILYGSLQDTLIGEAAAGTRSSDKVFDSFFGKPCCEGRVFFMPESAIVDRSAIERYNEKCVREIENACEQKRCMKETPAAIPGRD